MPATPGAELRIARQDANGNQINAYAPEVGTGSRINQNRDMTQDAALNLKWDPTNDLHFNFDGQYVNSQVDNYDLSVEMHSYADVALDATGAPAADHAQRSDQHQPVGWRPVQSRQLVSSLGHGPPRGRARAMSSRCAADGEYDFHSDWLNSLKFGARYADRKQLVQWSTYNWQNVANTWTDCSDAASRTLIGTSTASRAEPAPLLVKCSTAIRPVSTQCSRSGRSSSAETSAASRSFRSTSSTRTRPICSARS